MLGSPQLPKSNARLRFFWGVDVAAALHAVSCSSHCPTPPDRVPELAALAQALCWIAQERWRAAPALMNVAPLTEKGRAEAEEVTGGGVPPREPVNVWTLVLVAVAVEALIELGDTPEDAGEVQSEGLSVVVFVDGATPSAVFSGRVAVLAPVLVVVTAVAIPATAASISSAVASSTSSFWVKMHPGSSSRVSHVFPLAVGSLTSPGAKVPDLRAS